MFVVVLAEWLAGCVRIKAGDYLKMIEISLRSKIDCDEFVLMSRRNERVCALCGCAERKEPK